MFGLIDIRINLVTFGWLRILKILNFSNRDPSDHSIGGSLESKFKIYPNFGEEKLIQNF